MVIGVLAGVLNVSIQKGDIHLFGLFKMMNVPLFLPGANALTSQGWDLDPVLEPGLDHHHDLSIRTANDPQVEGADRSPVPQS